MIFMGEVELRRVENLLIIRSVFYFYGNGASDDLSRQIANDISQQWNEPEATVILRNRMYQVVFIIEGIFERFLLPENIFENTHPRNNYFRIEKYAHGNISYVDGIGSNTGYFKLENLIDHSTTAAHEYGHTIGLLHPKDLDIRGQGRPGIMFPRGTLVDPEFQYDPQIPAGLTGGTMNPFTRKVHQKDIDDLKLNRLDFDKNGFSMIGEFSSIWHDEEVQK
jgi:hypothetical protein